MKEFYAKYGRNPKVTDELVKKPRGVVIVISSDPVPPIVKGPSCILKLRAIQENHDKVKILLELVVEELQTMIYYELKNRTEMPSEAAKRRMDDHVHDEIDGVMYDIHSDASIYRWWMRELFKMKVNDEKAKNEWYC
ncbi:hypothetical protein Tco_1325958, partial [Tanacetum coccineum]